MLLPNQGWNRRVMNEPRQKRILYFAIRIGAALLVGVVVWLLGLHQHPALK